ncbi:flagellar biosynthetic protein FliR [Motilimonas pumila]|uniref:Flagellar biosynthetic protein FliR n=1 Tax=Motilimonas pumila TaxID=2303987 RepID=A0A418YGV0_9GAMM|nr:flagellar biosynthetic protein FliR [Motilimonas pumila]RJG49034.1 flagellar type III secretion system protein FliR [Motilimonas pumila]
MNLPAEVAIEWLSIYLWALARIGAMLMVMTAIGAQTTPKRVRLLLTLAITFMVVPVLPAPPPIELFSLAGFLVVLQQILIGTAIGTVSVFVMQTFVIAGQIIAMQTSLGFASMADPMNGQTSPVVGQFYLMLVTLLFLAFDGHLVMIAMIVESFTTLPISMEGISAMHYQKLAAWLGIMFTAALTMSMSSIVAMLLVNFSFGIMTRAAPQLNIFSLGFSISMLFGLFILWLTIGNVLGHFENQWIRGAEFMCELLNGACRP